MVNLSDILLELKIADGERELDKAAKDGLRQMAEKEYMTVFSKEDVRNVWKYGIAFCGKKVWME